MACAPGPPASPGHVSPPAAPRRTASPARRAARGPRILSCSLPMGPECNCELFANQGVAREPVCQWYALGGTHRNVVALTRLCPGTGSRLILPSHTPNPFSTGVFDADTVLRARRVL